MIMCKFTLSYQSNGLKKLYTRFNYYNIEYVVHIFI